MRMQVNDKEHVIATKENQVLRQQFTIARAGEPTSSSA